MNVMRRPGPCVPLLAALAFVLALGRADVGRADANTVVSGVQALRAADDLQPRWEHLGRYLEQTLGDVKVEVRALEHDALHDAVVAGALDVVIASPTEYLQFIPGSGLSAPLVGLVASAGDDAHRVPLRRFGGVVVARADDTRTNRFEDLRGHRVAVADVFDALITERVYKPAYSLETAHDTILRDAGRHFDPDIVAAFERRLHDFRAIAMRFGDRAAGTGNG